MSTWKWVAGSGVVLGITGIVALIWEQIALHGSPFGESALSRWQNAVAPLFLIGLGVLVVTGALLLRAVESRQAN